jgi:hypothetical protein
MVEELDRVFQGQQAAVMQIQRRFSDGEEVLRVVEAVRAYSGGVNIKKNWTV